MLLTEGHTVRDFGTDSEVPCDYPDFIRPVAEAVARGEFERASCSAVRATARRSSPTGPRHSVRTVLDRTGGHLEPLAQRREHALARPADHRRGDALAIVRTWLATPFEGGRHVGRIRKIDESIGSCVQLRFVGLGRMGGNMSRRLLAGGHQVVVWDRSADAVADARAKRRDAVARHCSMTWCRRLAPPRAVWVMVPAGDATEQTVTGLAERLAAAATSSSTAATAISKTTSGARGRARDHVVSTIFDVGTSGGVWGAERGYCLMIGGPQRRRRAPRADFQDAGAGPGDRCSRRAALDLTATTAHEGFLYCGPAGAGHFVKMIHNGIEYGLMQAYAEGFDILRNAGSEHAAGQSTVQSRPAEIAEALEAWQRGRARGCSILRRLALAGDPQARDSSLGNVAGLGRRPLDRGGRDRRGSPCRRADRRALRALPLAPRHTFAEKLLSALRAQFGGHVEPS